MTINKKEKIFLLQAIEYYIKNLYDPELKEKPYFYKMWVKFWDEKTVG